MFGWVLITSDPWDEHYDPLSSYSPPGLCCICPSVESSGRFGHRSSKSADSSLPAGLWSLGSRWGLRLLLPPHLGQDLLNLPLGQLEDKCDHQTAAQSSRAARSQRRLYSGVYRVTLNHFSASTRLNWLKSLQNSFIPTAMTLQSPALIVYFDQKKSDEIDSFKISRKSKSFSLLYQ